jgi:hypothetical protein
MIDTTHSKYKKIKAVAERVGFEPTVRFPVRSLSRRVLSTAQSPLRGRFVSVADRPELRQRRAASVVSDAGKIKRATQRRFADETLSPSSEERLDEPGANLRQNSSGYIDAMV